MKAFNTQMHPWVAKLKNADPRFRPNRKAIALFDRMVYGLSTIRTSASNRYFSLPNDFCVSAVDFEMGGRQFSIDVSVDYIASHTSGQAVQASFLVEKDGKGWNFMIHDPNCGVVCADWYPATHHVARTKTEFILKLGLFAIHLQQNYP